MGTLIVALLIPAMVGTWFAVTGLLASKSGWTDLADTFPGGERPQGKVLRRSVFKVGSVGEEGVTSLIATTQGLYLAPSTLFRFRRPPVHVPWNRIRYVESHRVLWKRSITVDLGGITTLRVHPRVIAELLAHGVQIPQDATA
ncbi:MAG: hypothetical protein ACREJC_09465 [Tepidisphaeraceae bacterium]